MNIISFEVNIREDSICVVGVFLFVVLFVFAVVVVLNHGMPKFADQLIPNRP